MHVSSTIIDNSFSPIEVSDVLLSLGEEAVGLVRNSETSREGVL